MNLTEQYAYKINGRFLNDSNENKTPYVESVNVPADCLALKREGVCPREQIS